VTDEYNSFTKNIFYALAVTVNINVNKTTLKKNWSEQHTANKLHRLGKDLTVKLTVTYHTKTVPVQMTNLKNLNQITCFINCKS